MANAKPTTAGVNPQKIVWETDRAGILTLLRKEGCRAAGRIQGDNDKLKLYISTLKTLAEHATAKCADDIVVKGRVLDKHKKRVADQLAQEAKSAARHRVGLEAQIKSLQHELESGSPAAPEADGSAGAPQRAS